MSSWTRTENLHDWFEHGWTIKTPLLFMRYWTRTIWTRMKKQLYVSWALEYIIPKLNAEDMMVLENTMKQNQKLSLHITCHVSKRKANNFSIDKRPETCPEMTSKTCPEKTQSDHTSLRRPSIAPRRHQWPSRQRPSRPSASNWCPPESLQPMWRALASSDSVFDKEIDLVFSMSDSSRPSGHRSSYIPCRTQRSCRGGWAWRKQRGDVRPSW